MILVKKLEFFHLLCLSNIDREKSLLTLWIEKKPFKTIRTSVYKERRTRFFPKRQGHDFGKKVEPYSSFVFIKRTSRKRIC